MQTNSTSQRLRGQWSGRAGERGHQRGFVRIETEGDLQQQGVVRQAEAKGILPFSRKKRGDVKGFFGRKGKVIGLMPEHVEMGFAKGVVHLGEDAEHLVLLIVAIKKTDWIEDIMELPQGSDEDDAGGRLVEAVFFERPVDLGDQGRVAGVKVVAVMESERSNSVIAEPEGIAVQLFQFVEIQGKEVEAVDKAVLDLMGAGMAQLPGKELRVHALSCKSLIAWTLERTASSWNP